jgi:nucleoside-diphosphate-sugar epimerase
LGYAPTHTVSQGIAEAVPWYVSQAKRLEVGSN